MNIKKRKFTLLLIDALLIIGIYYAIQFLTLFKVSSVQVHGAFTITKLCAILVCILGSRLLFRIYSLVWRYSDVQDYIRLVIADIVGGIAYICLGRINFDFNIGLEY